MLNGSRCKKEFDHVLRMATALIEEKYFLLNVDGGDPIFRERVYCYELYHRMRCNWIIPDFDLNAEVDKSGHPQATLFDSRFAKPDFLVHGPGEMRDNDTIIEVKKARAEKVDIQKDLKTLSDFLREWEYKRAIYLLVGYNEKLDCLRRICEAATDKDYRPIIEIWHHSAPLKPAIFYGRLNK